MRAIVVSECGGPEVLQVNEVEAPAPGPGEARVRVEACGVNFIDIYHRTGQYKLERPFTPGMEAAGVVEAAGEGVDAPRPGERVAYAMQLGSYAEQAVVPAWKLVPIPEGLETERALAGMLQGMTAHYLSHSTFALGSGHTALVHAAAGGVGRLLVQMAKRRGARVIATASGQEKAALAREAGADEVIDYTRRDFSEDVRRFTDSRGVDVVYDSVGKDTFERGLRCLKPRGVMVLYGQSSGAIPPMDPQVLSASGSIFLTRPTLAHYAASREELMERAGSIFGWIRSGELQVRIDSTFPLDKAADAHRHLEARLSRGKILLVP